MFDAVDDGDGDVAVGGNFAVVPVVESLGAVVVVVVTVAA